MSRIPPSSPLVRFFKWGGLWVAGALSLYAHYTFYPPSYEPPLIHQVKPEIEPRLEILQEYNDTSQQYKKHEKFTGVNL